jgi:hypothetical protein
VELTTEEPNVYYDFPDAGPGITGSLILRNYASYNMGEVGIYGHFAMMCLSPLIESLHANTSLLTPFPTF